MLAVVTPCGFEEFVRAFGQPAPELVLPPAPDTPPDLAASEAAAAEAGVRFLGPPIQTS